MTSDQEPRYRLVDDDGNIVGSLYGKADGSIAIQETASGADREVALAPDGTFSAPSVETESVSTDSATVTNGVDAGSVATKIVSNDYFYAGSYDGNTPEDRLDNALQDIDTGQTIYLENESYDARTIDKPIAIIGSGSDANNPGTVLEDWDVSSAASIQNTVVETTAKIEIGKTKTFNIGMIGNSAEIRAIGSGATIGFIDSREDWNPDIVFESDTEGGSVGLVSGPITITDNGNNEILTG